MMSRREVARTGVSLIAIFASTWLRIQLLPVVAISSVGHAYIDGYISIRMRKNALYARER
ncbi:hypothetical protein LINPERHAP1_LOCUS23583 [Linum perenne]